MKSEKMKVNAILAAESAKEKNNGAETSKVNSFALVEDENDIQDMILVRNPNIFR